MGPLATASRTRTTRATAEKRAPTAWVSPFTGSRKIRPTPSPSSCRVWVLPGFPTKPGAPPEGSVFFRWDRPARTGPWGPSAPASSTQEEDPGTAPEILVRQRHAWGESPHLAARPSPPHRRSEEHTSELQSRENLVCRLLL